MRTVDIIREIRKSKSQITKKIMEIKYVNEIEKREMEMILNDLNATSREISKHEWMIMERYNEEIKEKENEENERNQNKERWIIGLHNINGMVFEKDEGKKNHLEKIELTEEYLDNSKVLLYNM